MIMDDDRLMHIGMPRRSGRYPWGSGENPYQSSGDLLSRVEELTKEGMSEKDLAAALKMSTTDLRLQLKVAKHERRMLLVDQAKGLRAKGYSLKDIATKMGYKNDSSVRSLLNENTASNKNKARQTADILKKTLAEKGDMVDVGIGVERVLGVSPNVLKEALFLLGLEGYNVYPIGIPQINRVGKQSNTKILATEDVPYSDAYKKMGDIRSVGEYTSEDGGDSFRKVLPPASVNTDRIFVRYGDKGGANKDGVIELRRGVEDLNLGKSHYAQVRILAGKDHYLKGMAMYSDDIPDGYDIVFNTNKKTGTKKLDTLKKIETDPTNPFGAYIKADGQSMYTTKSGKEKLSAINKLKDEGDWDAMSINLSSQFLSKQPQQLIDKQLNLTYADADAAYSEIKSLQNPTVKKKLLLDFANQCDGAAVHLKAASLPRQKTQVILPLNDISEKEIYAPNYRNGETVSLIRYPHGGMFEIPQLTVNNRNKAGIKIFGKNVQDAVGINPKTASILSGADFDGDQVVVIPTNSRVKIKGKPPLQGLVGFEPKDDYAYVEGMKVMSKSNTGAQMGRISNLITDMTLKGAKDDELVRAVKHSMVVIDAAKHKLNYKQSEKDNDIKLLREKYQGHTDLFGEEKGGASTLLSRRKTEISVPERKGSGVIDPKTGKVSYKESGREYINKDGKTIKATTKVKSIHYVDDVHQLSSGSRPERAYADYANKMKALGNSARKEYLATGNLVYSPDAAKKYKEQVDSLNAKLNISKLNAPKERRANALANSVIKAKIQANPEMDKKEVRKISQQAIYNAREKVGASMKQSSILFTDKEWEAAQSGAISDTKLASLLNYADMDDIRERATPKTVKEMSPAAIARIKALRASGHTNAEIAQAIGKSTSTVSKYLNM